jgi:DNA-directed RNA polymerase omega subunit
MDTPELAAQPPVTPADVPPVTNRFLFVDIAALRAKQLRRGATPRVDTPTLPHKPERIAMEEVRRGFVQYDVPGIPARPDQEESS